MKKLQNDINALKNINWDFRDKGVLSSDDKKPFDSRKFHWYPATYIPEIPYSLIEILSKEGSTIYDPFAGSGTTFFQALILNRNSITSDSNKISVNYIKAIADILMFSEDLSNFERQAISLISEFKKTENYTSFLSDTKKDLLFPWFNKESLNELSFIYKLYSESKDKLKNLFYVLLASLIKSISSQNRGWGYIADNVKPSDKEKEYYKNVILLFQRKLSQLIKELKIVKKNIKDVKEDFSNNIFQYDVTKENIFIENNTVDLIITSPPYPNMIDYSKSQRLLYYFFDLDMDEDLNNEIGARAFRNRKNSISDYIEKMELGFYHINKTLKNKGLICLVLPFYKNIEIGNNLLRQQAIKELLKWFENNNFVIKEEIIRTISATKRNQNTSLASLNYEKIIIMRKEL